MLIQCTEFLVRFPPFWMPMCFIWSCFNALFCNKVVIIIDLFTYGASLSLNVQYIVILLVGLISYEWPFAINVFLWLLQILVVVANILSQWLEEWHQKKCQQLMNWQTWQRGYMVKLAKMLQDGWLVIKILLTL